MPRGTIRTKLYFIICLMLVLLDVMAIGTSLFVIYQKETSVEPKQHPCKSFPSRTFIRANKIPTQWHQTYEFDELNGSITLACPGFNYNTNVYLDNSLLVAKSQFYFSSDDISKNKIYDCHGDLLYIGRFVSNHTYELYDANDQTMLMYTEELGYDMHIKNINGTEIARLTGDENHWDFIKDPDTDMRVLSILVGTQSFGTDMCNQYFFVASLVVAFVLWVLLLLFISVLIY